MLEDKQTNESVSYEVTPQITPQEQQGFRSPDSGIIYPEKLIPDTEKEVHLDTTNTAVEIYMTNVAALGSEEFALARRNGFGGSDVSVLLGVNPFTSLNELIAQKVSKTVSEEEKAIGTQVAVMKGNDLEPLIIHKFQNIFQIETLKPTDMYVFRDFDYLKMDFDGVAGTPDQYIPVEIKVVTKKGEKHYDPFKAMYIEWEGFKQTPDNHTMHNNSIATKASQYGIPPYYYTQIQAEMMALNAPYGFLATLWEATWTMHVYLIHQDLSVWNNIKIEGFKAWQQVLNQKGAANANSDQKSQTAYTIT